MKTGNDIAKRNHRKGAVPAFALTGLFLIFLAIGWMTAYLNLSGKEVSRYQRIAETAINSDAMVVYVMENTAWEFFQVTRERDGERLSANDDEPFYDWDMLESINDDVAGWICLPELIDFPVVGAADNQFYLSHDFTGEKSSLGCPFMDKDTEKDDFNRVIYGHNMGIGSDAMFSPLIKYENRDYFDKNRVLLYKDRYEEVTVYEVIAVLKYNIKETAEWDFRVRNHDSREDYLAWMEKLEEKALFYREPEEVPNRLITLATCDRRMFGKDGRFLILSGA